MDRHLHDDARIKIYPTVLFVVNVDSIKDILDHLDQYVEGGEKDEETDED